MSGTCEIKAEYVLPSHDRKLLVDHVADSDRALAEETEPPIKKPHLEKSHKEKPKLKGQNKARGPCFKRDNKQELCNCLVDVGETQEVLPECTKQRCDFMHSIEDYLKIKPPDLGEKCYVFDTHGYCLRGASCRFASSHLSPTGRNLKKHAIEYSIYKTKNQLKHEVQNALRKHAYNFDKTQNLIKYNEKKSKAEFTESTSEETIKLTMREKPQINWKNKLVLSPLTTVGNLPFRRICKGFGADVTCGEMAVCKSLLQGESQEWALVKRHESEDIFGVQLCGNNPHILTKCGQLLEQEAEIDFIDLNLGCPIDWVYKSGAGSALLRRPKVLEACIRNLSQILSVPLTVKTRTGVYRKELIAHSLVPKFYDWGASIVTVHGRTREARYTNLADWNYISQIAKSVSPKPILGNGDILSYKDYKIITEQTPELTSVVIGRGALIKPWIFTEIKEQKIWDIQSTERLDILKKYTNYGLEHWGSDNKGVENTRRFLLEWLSFLYRYIPVGLLEKPPQKMNERPPNYKGRNDLETLMASPSVADWIKLSEMLLGPVPESFRFLPKHKANSYQ